MRLLVESIKHLLEEQKKRIVARLDEQKRIVDEQKRIVAQLEEQEEQIADQNRTISQICAVLLQALTNQTAPAGLPA